METVLVLFLPKLIRDQEMCIWEKSSSKWVKEEKDVTLTKSLQPSWQIPRRFWSLPKLNKHASRKQ